MRMGKKMSTNDQIKKSLNKTDNKIENETEIIHKNIIESDKIEEDIRIGLNKDVQNDFSVMKTSINHDIKIDTGCIANIINFDKIENIIHRHEEIEKIIKRHREKKSNDEE